MEYFHQLKWLRNVSPNLPLFKDKGNDVFNCRCIICGDSEHDEHKARGYFYKIKDNLAYKCHNCGASMSLINFMKDNFPREYKEALMDLMEEKKESEEAAFNSVQERLTQQREEALKKLEEIKLKKKKEREIAQFPNLSEVSEDNPCRKYIEKRGLGDFLNLFYYIPDVGKLRNALPAYKDKKPVEGLNVPAIGIPHWNRDKSRLEFMQCRMLNEGKLRYLTLTVMATEDTHKLFGLERVNLKAPFINITEGAFDSLCVDNSVAISGLQSWQQAIGGSIPDNVNLRFIVDNDWETNKSVKKTLRHIIKHKHHVVIFPEYIRRKYKDLNDMYMDMSREELASLVEEHTYKDLEAQLLLK